MKDPGNEVALSTCLISTFLAYAAPAVSLETKSSFTVTRLQAMVGFISLEPK